MIRKIPFVLVFISITAFGQDVNTILNNYFENIGGQQLLESIRNSSIKSHVITFHPKVDTSYNTTIAQLPTFLWSEFYAAGKKSATSETFQNEKANITRFYDLGMEHPGKLHAISLSTPHQILKLQQAKDFKKSRDTVINEIPCYGLVTKHKLPQINSVYYFNKTTNDLIAFSREDLKNDITLFLDHREVKGIRVPFVTEYFLHGQLISKTIYQSIEFDIDVDKKMFYPSNWKSKREHESEYNHIEFVDPTKTNGSFTEFIQLFAGQRILIDLWATWCAPCKIEFNTYDSNFYKFLEDHRVKMVFLSFDDSKKETQWKNDIETYNINGYHALSGKNLTKSISKEIYGGAPMYIPRYILIDEDGTILSKEMRKPSSGKAFQAEIETHLKK